MNYLVTAIDLRNCATDLTDRLTRVLGEVCRADVRDVAIRTDQNPESLGRDEFGRMSATQMIEESLAIIEQEIGHPIAGMQTSSCDARG